MDGLLLDLRHALRSLRRNPLFTVLAGVTLALGIGANVAVFAVANGVVLRPLAYADPDRLVRLFSSVPARGLSHFSVSYPDYEDWKLGARAFSELAAYERERGVVLLGDGRQPEEVYAARIGAGLFELLGVPPLTGRGITAAEVRAGSPVAVVSEGFWLSVLGGERAVLGRTLVLDGVAHTVIGVMPAGFTLPSNDAVVWTPLPADQFTDRGNRFLRVLGRLAPGATVAQAHAEMERLTSRLASEYPDTNLQWRITIETLNDLLVGREFRRGIEVLLGVVALVLLIACVNVTNLLLSRAISRRQDAAVRTALGASAGRLLRGWLLETLLLAGAAGALGLLVGAWCVELLRAIAGSEVPRIDEVGVGARVLLFGFGVSLLAGLLLGVGPAVYAARVGGRTQWREENRGHTAGRRTHRLRGGLLVAETMMAVLLLTGALLLVRSLMRLQRVELGFDPNGVLVAAVPLPPARYAEPDASRSFYRALFERVRSIPGVRTSAGVSVAPFAGPNSALNVQIDGMAPPVGEQLPDADFRVVTPEYFEAMRIALRRGRTFRAEDGGGSVAVITETMARRHWPGRDPVGARMRLGAGSTEPWYTIIGVVADARYQSVETPDVRPMFYLPHDARPSMALVLRIEGDGAPIVNALRAAVAELDPQLAAGSVRRMEDLVSGVYAQARFQLLLFGVFALLAVVLAGVGIYGVTSYAVAQRTRELGVRMALGAHPARLVRMILSNGFGLGLIGVLLGTGAALALTRLIRSLLFETDPRDPLVIAAAAASLLAVSALATYVPARRATRIDPLTALRVDT